MTIESCVAFCNSKSFIYAGTEYSQECCASIALSFNWLCTCSSARCALQIAGVPLEIMEPQLPPLTAICRVLAIRLRPAALAVRPILCILRSACLICKSCRSPEYVHEQRQTASWSDNCSASWFVEVTWVLQVSLASSSGAQYHGDRSSWVLSDSTTARTLGVAMGTTGGVTVESCTSACQNGGYALCGTEYADECYCGNSFANGGAPTPLTDCNMACAANASEFCGGPNRLNVSRQAVRTIAGLLLCLNI